MPDTALLVLDFQNNVVARYGTPEVLEAAGRAVGAARAAGVPVIFARVAFRPGFPEVATTNLMLGGMPQRAAGRPADPEGVEIHAAVAPVGDEPVLTKVRVSAFAGSALDAVLRASGVRRLVLAGLATSGVVLSTLRQAADLDFELTVLADACADIDPEVHRVLTEKVFPQQATVMDVDRWIGLLPGTLAAQSN
ncbi:isochorismatase [Cellulomonas sp. WB94]|uniref:cysteine hydrolase family protein n=1 Tax=Cellulomonas sp. WB94 TaxID=2173174 RepID=UPI000D57A3BF|nr:cysteine hydrolase [Cellulomonas sp. WB94]PVU82880.1 isochorismatase [Cellulomonas sp. WB94]